MIRHPFDLTSAVEAETHFARYNDPIRALRTPFPNLNDSCRGFGGRQGYALGWYVVLGGDTGQGKSLLALQHATDAIKQGYRAGFVSMEMSEAELRNRFYAQMVPGVSARDLEPGPDFNPATAERVKFWADKWREEHGYLPLLAEDDCPPDVREVEAMMTTWMTEQDVEVFVVDYLQLLEHPEGVGSAKEVQKISAAMREFAHRNRVLVIALSQYNNEGGNDRTRSPHVGHLYGGRRISQDSDVTVLLDHSRYVQDAQEPWIARSYLMHPKNRHGPKGYEIPIEWDYRTLTAREAMPDELHRWPEHDARRYG